jgi:hypothetical protein
MTLSGLPAAVRRWTKPAKALLARLALSAPMDKVLRRRSLPIRLSLPGLCTEEPELCSWGESPTKAASALGVKAAMLGSSASRMTAVTSPRPVMPRHRARLRVSTASVAMTWRAWVIRNSIGGSSQSRWAAMERATSGEANPAC